MSTLVGTDVVTDAARKIIKVEIVYAEPAKQVLLQLAVPDGTTAAGALGLSGIEKEFPDADFGNAHFGIWGQPISGTQLLRAGDRLEIYRELDMDPREARRRLAAHGGAMGQRVADDN